MAELVKDQMLEGKMAKDKMVEDEVDIIRYICRGLYSIKFKHFQALSTF